MLARRSWACPARCLIHLRVQLGQTAARDVAEHDHAPRRSAARPHQRILGHCAEGWLSLIFTSQQEASLRPFLHVLVTEKKRWTTIDLGVDGPRCTLVVIVDRLCTRGGGKVEEEWSVEACNSCGVHEGMNEGILRQEEGCWQEEGCFRHEGWIAQRCGYGRWGSVQGRGRGKRVATIAAFREKSRFRACPVSKWDRKISPLDCLRDVTSARVSL